LVAESSRNIREWSKGINRIRLSGVGFELGIKINIKEHGIILINLQ
jgi:hypothetical protein